MKQNKSVRGRRTWGLVWFRFKKNKLAICGLIILILLLVAILAAPLYTDSSLVYKQNIIHNFQAPSSEYIFGTDQFGRDLFTRIVYGGRISLFVGLAVVLVAFVVGCVLGGVAGYFGGVVDTVIMRIVDMFMAIPAILLSMAVVAALGNGTEKMLVALAVAQTPRFTRVVRSSIMTLRSQEFVERPSAMAPARRRSSLSTSFPTGSAR